MADPGRRRLAAGLAAAVVLAAITAVAFLPPRAGGMPGRASAADYVDTAGIDTSGDADRQQALIGAIMADLTQFWSQALPPITGTPFTPLDGDIVAVDSSAPSGTAPCVATPSDIVGNAYYCPSDDGIVYDATTLIPVVLHRSGIGGLITTFAHEFGHAVQARIASAGGAASAAAPSPLVTEARADCDAGAFLAWSVAGNAPHLHVSDDVLIGAIGPLVDFSDPATVRPDDPTAHGLAVDRLSWFMTGFQGSAATCTHLGEPLITALGQVDSPPSTAPRYGTRGLLLAAAEHSIDTFTGARSSASPSAAMLDAAAPHGQFAQATVVALATAANDGDTPVAAACIAGSWVHSVFGRVPAHELGGWPGDADEGLAAVLLQPGVTFDDVTAYIEGFQSGTSAC